MKQWISEPKKPRMNEWIRGSTTEWSNEPMDQWINKTTKWRMNESVDKDSVNQWNSVSMKQCINDSMNECINETLSQWIVDGWSAGWMDGWRQGWMDGRMDGLMDGCMDGSVSERLSLLCELITSALSDLFAEAPFSELYTSFRLWAATYGLLVCSFCNPILLSAQLFHCI